MTRGRQELSRVDVDADVQPGNFRESRNRMVRDAMTNLDSRRTDSDPGMPCHHWHDIISLCSIVFFFPTQFLAVRSQPPDLALVEAQTIMWRSYELDVRR